MFFLLLVFVRYLHFYLSVTTLDFSIKGLEFVFLEIGIFFKDFKVFKSN